MDNQWSPLTVLQCMHMPYLASVQHGDALELLPHLMYKETQTTTSQGIFKTALQALCLKDKWWSQGPLDCFMDTESQVTESARSRHPTRLSV